MMNKQFKRFFFLFLVLVSLLILPSHFFPSGHGDVTVAVSSIYPPDNAATLDTTPNFRCTPISDVSEYVNVTLYVNDVASGTVTNHPNGTEVVITCNRTLPISDEKIPWYFTVTDEEGTYETEPQYISIGAYFIAPAVLLNPNATTEHWTYYLNASVSNCTSSPAINIPDNNITLNGQGYTLDGDDIANYGICANRTSPTITNIIICNITLTDWNLGLHFENCSGNTFSYITARSNIDGLNLVLSDDNILTNIVANDNVDVGLALSNCSGNTISYVTANGNGALGFNILWSHSNNLINVTANNNTDTGLFLYYSDSNNLTNVTANGNALGLSLHFSDANIVHDCIFQNNKEYGVHLYSAGNPANTFYNNLFNNTHNVGFEGTVYVNYWNTKKQLGTRIYSAGPYIGGNYWTNPTGTGPSDTGIDADCDGFLDSPLEIETNNTDYLPYSNKYLPGWHRHEEEITPTPPEAEFCLPLAFSLLLGAVFVFGLYLYSQRETWKISIPLILIVLWLILFEPKTPIDQMPIVILRYFVVPPWHIYMAIILTIIACAALLTKK